jgi:small subunit ribosomal protein S16
MAVKIRLTRTGKKKQPTYRVVVMDSRKPRDGEYIEQIGRYDPRQDPSLIEIDNERALDWLHKGAQPTERAQKLLEISGAWGRFRVDKGEIHTVGEHRPKPQPENVVTLAAPDLDIAQGVEEAELGRVAEAGGVEEAAVAGEGSEDE